MKYYITQAGVKFLNEVNKSKYKDMKFQQGGRWGSDMEIERRRPRGRTGDSAPSPFGWSSAEWESLKKMVSLLAVSSVILRKYAKEGTRNEYIKLVIGALWQHKIDETDCIKIIEARDICKKEFT